MNGFWGGLSCAIVVLSIGGCSMLKNIGTAKVIEAKAKAQLIKVQIEQTKQEEQIKSTEPIKSIQNKEG